MGNNHKCPICGALTTNYFGHYYCPKHGCVWGDCFYADGRNAQEVLVIEKQKGGVR